MVNVMFLDSSASEESRNDDFEPIPQVIQKEDNDNGSTFRRNFFSFMGLRQKQKEGLQSPSLKNFARKK